VCEQTSAWISTFYHAITWAGSALASKMCKAK